MLTVELACKVLIRHVFLHVRLIHFTAHSTSEIRGRNRSSQRCNRSVIIPIKLDVTFHTSWSSFKVPRHSAMPRHSVMPQCVVFSVQRYNYQTHWMIAVLLQYKMKYMCIMQRNIKYFNLNQIVYKLIFTIHKNQCFVDCWLVLRLLTKKLLNLCLREGNLLTSEAVWASIVILIRAVIQKSENSKDKCSILVKYSGLKFLLSIVFFFKWWFSA